MFLEIFCQSKTVRSTANFKILSKSLYPIMESCQAWDSVANCQNSLLFCFANFSTKYRWNGNKTCSGEVGNWNVVAHLFHKTLFFPGETSQCLLSWNMSNYWRPPAGQITWTVMSGNVTNPAGRLSGLVNKNPGKVASGGGGGGISSPLRLLRVEG
jgi:hypothetical protein